MNTEFTRRKIAQILVIVAVGTFMSALNSSIVNISLPTISSYFSVPLTTVEWVILSYLIVITSLLLAFGKLGDLYGHKKIYNIGFIVFTVSSLACALSPTIIMLIAARVLQAVGAGMLMSMGPAIITISTLNKDTKIFLIVIYLAVIGLGIGFFQTPNNSAIMGSVPSNYRGVASSMIAAMRHMGMVLGVAISGTIFSSRFNYLSRVLATQNISELDLKSQAFTGAFKATFMAAAILSSIAIFTSLIRGSLITKKRCISL